MARANLDKDQLKCLWKWVDSLSEEDDDYKSLPKNDRGKILMGKIPYSRIPTKFKEEFFKIDSIKQNLSTTDIIRMSNKLDDISEIQTVDVGSKSSRSIIQMIDAIKQLQSGKAPQTVTQNLIAKYNIEQHRARAILKQAREVNSVIYRDSMPTIKSDLFNAYSALYEEAKEKGNLKVAKEILDSITSLTGAKEPDKVLNLSEVIVKFKDEQ